MSFVQYGIYYRDPETDLYYPCTSGGHRYFSDVHHDPALFASEKNAAKMIKRWIKEAAHDSHYDEIEIVDDNHNDRTIRPIPYGDIKIIPIKLIPDLKQAVTGPKP